jgi:hypothetical protein
MALVDQPAAELRVLTGKIRQRRQGLAVFHHEGSVKFNLRKHLNISLKLICNISPGPAPF